MKAVIFNLKNELLFHKHLKAENIKINKQDFFYAESSMNCSYFKKDLSKVTILVKLFEKVKWHNMHLEVNPKFLN